MANTEIFGMIIHICIMCIGFGFAAFLLFVSAIGLATQWTVGIIEFLTGCYGLYYVIRNMPRDDLYRDFMDNFIAEQNLEIEDYLNR